jgi:hypothetical protein
MLFGGAIPIQPGKTERARRFAEELEPHRAEYEALNERYGVRQNAIWISHSRDGRDLYVNVYDVEPEGRPPMGARTWDVAGSAYDRWWVGWVQDVLGIDMLAERTFAAPPEPIFTWRAEDRS